LIARVNAFDGTNASKVLARADELIESLSLLQLLRAAYGTSATSRGDPLTSAHEGKAVVLRFHRYDQV